MNENDSIVDIVTASEVITLNGNVSFDNNFNDNKIINVNNSTDIYQIGDLLPPNCALNKSH